MKYPIRAGASERTINQLTAKYKEVFDQIVDEILLMESFSGKDRRQIEAEIEELLEDLGEDVFNFIEVEFPRYYVAGADNAVNQLIRNGFIVAVVSGLGRRHKQAISAIIDETKSLFEDSLAGVKRQFTSILGKASKEYITSLFTDDVDISDVKNIVKLELIEKGLGAFVDKGGRRWSLDRYTEMLIRTKTVETRNRGLINRMLENEYDLVEVSKHGGACELCIPWEGRILSLTGATKGYPTLADAESEGFFHPNCRHAINTLHKDLAIATDAYIGQD
jgi:hypothetical protein